MKKLMTMAATVLLLSACQKNADHSAKDELSTGEKIVIPGEGNLNARSSQEEKYNTFYGPAVQFGKGHVRSWVNISHEDKPLAIGMEFTEGVLHQEHSHEGGDAHGHEVLLQLHQKAKGLMPFDHLTMGYMAEGHPPPGIYSVPHFDFHFYKISLEERLAIPSYPEAMAAFNNNPPAGYIPLAYVKAPAGEARMGAHWMDVLSPEFNGQPFTHTFVYGSYDGKVNFLEPMASIAFIQEGTTVQKAIRQPQLFDPVNTYYPTRYNIWKDEKKDRHYIALDQMVWR
ncbi:hypothetical protein HRH25_05820 [Flavisolibacter sp. BT320]|nr:hypothetical protein [Flavisolibacter longurius]